VKLIKPVDWRSETSFVVDGLEFSGDLETYREETTPERVVILKTGGLLRQYLDMLAPHDTGNILELGIWQGGSPLFYGKATDAKKVVAIDLRAKNPALDEIIETHGLGDRVKLHFNTSQDDREAVESIIETDFDGQPIDLVIDDASHLYEPTKRSFEIIFPKLRQGGLYIIEDWQWAHLANSEYQDGTKWGDQPALSNFIFELLMAYGSEGSLFWNIVVRDWFIAIQKGSYQAGGDFKINDLIRMRGRSMWLI
jgi:predicted O-methyltransferase YrrM